MSATEPTADARAPGPAPREHGVPPLSDPGKDDRAERGVPVVPAFDGYRAYAILSIVLLHVLASSRLLQEAGDSLGGQLLWGTLPHFVDVLFIVSGFVVFLPTVAQRGDFGSVPGYAIRRAARLLPAFWLSLGVLLVLMAIAGYPWPGGGELLANFSGQESIAAWLEPSLLIGFGINLPLWTLTIEISFYIVLPFVATAYFRRPLVGLAIAALIAIGWRALFTNIGDVSSLLGLDLTAARIDQLQLNAGNQLPSWAFSFAAGMTGAWAYVRLRELHSPERLARIAPLVLAGALAAFVACAWAAGRYAIGNEFPLPALLARESAIIALGYTAALATGMVALALAATRLQRPFAHPLARRLGDISYGVYLIHAVVGWFIGVEIGILTDGSVAAVAAWTAAIVPISLAYGYVSARFLEQPVRRWAHRYGRQAQAKRPVEPALGRPGNR